MMLAWRSALLVAFVVAFAVPVHAQDSANPRADAARLYEQGLSEAERGRFERAAELFLRAHHTLPSLPAIAQAVLGFERGDELVRAANAAILLEAFLAESDRSAFAESELDAAEALRDRVLRAAAEQLVRVVVDCDRCAAVEVGGAYFPKRFFVVPEATHRVTLHLPDGGRESVEVRAAAGERRRVEPPPPVPTETARTEDDRSGAHPGWFIGLAAATAALGATLVWSGLDVVAKHDAYLEDMTLERYEDGRRRERRTNGLAGATAGFAAVALVVGLLTDWGSRDDGSLDARLGVDLAGGMALSLSGAW